jgi:hypothetical protein
VFGILARRIGNRWWAAAAVWVLAINPFLMKTYSIAVSQGLIACLLIWTLVFIIGEKRPLWQIAIGAALAAATVMTRINLLPVLPLVILYVFWQHGTKAGLIALLSGGVVFIGIHAYYWPGIMQLWSRFTGLIPFMRTEHASGSSSRMAWHPNPTTLSRILSFFRGIMGQFTAVVGVLIAIICWPRKDSWKNKSDLRTALLLVVLFTTLLVMHFWASLTKSYCVSCFPGYGAFFSVIGLLIIILTAANWRQHMPLWIQVLIVILVLGLFTAFGLGSFETLGATLTDLSLPHWLVGSSSTDVISLGAVLSNKFGLEVKILRRLLPIILGAGIGFLTLAAALIIYMFSRRRTVPPGKTASFGYWALVLMLLVGTILTPTPLIGGAVFAYDCGGDVIASYEAAGKHLAENIPPGSSVFWKGGLSVIPLLYVPNIRIFPAQINGMYNYQLGESQEPLDRKGMWNNTLAVRWANEADYILVQEHSYTGWLKLLTESGNYDELKPTLPTERCWGGSQIHIFRQVRP